MTLLTFEHDVEDAVGEQDPVAVELRRDLLVQAQVDVVALVVPPDRRRATLLALFERLPQHPVNGRPVWARASPDAPAPTL